MMKSPLISMCRGPQRRLRVELLGTGGYYPNERRHTTCVILPESRNRMVDMPARVFFRVLPRLPGRLNCIFSSHSHLDHIFGLTCILEPLVTGKLQRAHLYAKEPTLAAIRDHLFNPAVFPVMPGYHFHALTPSVEVPGGGVLTHTGLEHPGGSTGFRIDWPDRSLAFITDTTADGSYTEFVRGVGLLIHECYSSDKMAGWATRVGHSHTTPVAELARDAGVNAAGADSHRPALDGAGPH